MKTKIINSINAIEWPFIILVLTDTLSNSDINYLIDIGMIGIYFYWINSKQLERDVDHMIVTRNLEIGMELDIVTATFDVSENVLDVFNFFYNLDRKEIKNYILL